MRISKKEKFKKMFWRLEDDDEDLCHIFLFPAFSLTSVDDQRMA